MYTLGIDIGSTTVKVAVLDKDNKILFSDYKRHFANIKETLKDLVQEAKDALGENEVNPCITGSGGLALAQLIGVPFTQEVVCVSEALQDYAPQTDVAIELGGEDAKIIYFTNGIEQRMNGVCAGGTGSFIEFSPKQKQPQGVAQLVAMPYGCCLTALESEVSIPQKLCSCNTPAQISALCIKSFSVLQRHFGTKRRMCCCKLYSGGAARYNGGV